VAKSVDKVARTDASVLITGETGTGKELFARAIHQCSQRCHRPLIKVNCAALPAGLVESELFGHEKGAFTGALQRKIGRFELAHQGTIFLDEIGDIPPETQVKLLRVLQEHECQRVGGTETIPVNVRVIAATNRDLGAAIAQQTFRADLFYRLNVFPISIPPLRERREDIPLLAQYFVDKYTQLIGKPIDRIHPATLERLVEYAWPGNVRELENVIERGVILAEGPILRIEENWLGIALRNAGVPDEWIPFEEMERTYLCKVLQKTKWVIGGKKGAAEILNMHPNTLRSRLAKLGIKKSDE
jgi:transcriptional regulator with GAF, ATPase, and Fis domain